MISACIHWHLVATLALDVKNWRRPMTISIYYIYVSANSNWVHSPRATPGDSLKKIAPGGRDLTSESCLGAGNSTRAGILGKVQTMLKCHINVCSGGDLCSEFLTIFVRHPVWRLVSRQGSIYWEGGGGSFPPNVPPPKRPPKRKFFLKKIKSYFKYWSYLIGISEGY